jgi:hypothetical protein
MSVGNVDGPSAGGYLYSMTTTTTTTAKHLALGIDRLRARPHGTRYTYRAEEIGETLSVTAAEVRLLGRLILAGTVDAYSLWCSSTPTRRAR